MYQRMSAPNHRGRIPELYPGDRRMRNNDSLTIEAGKPGYDLHTPQEDQMQNRRGSADHLPYRNSPAGRNYSSMDAQLPPQRSAGGSVDRTGSPYEAGVKPLQDVYIGSQRSAVRGIRKPSPASNVLNGSDPQPAHLMDALDRAKMDEDKMLIEQDPFLLEEQRYLSKLQRANFR